MSQAAESSELINVVVLLGAAVVAIPLFRRLGLGSVLGYLAAGLAIGPFGLGCSMSRRRSCMWPSWAW